MNTHSIIIIKNEKMNIYNIMTKDGTAIYS